MATLTNHYRDCQLLNLGYGPKGRGPFVIRQEGTPQGSTTFDADPYLLRKDGTWVINLAVFALPEKEKEQFFFTTSAEAMALLEGLVGDPVVESALPQGKSRAELKNAAQTTITGLWAKIREAKPS
jgi:hypothetical protein